MGACSAPRSPGKCGRRRPSYRSRNYPRIRPPSLPLRSRISTRTVSVGTSATIAARNWWHRIQKHPQAFFALPQGLFRPLALSDVLSDDHQTKAVADAQAAGPGLNLDHGAVFTPRHVFTDNETVRLDLFQAELKLPAVLFG